MSVIRDVSKTKEIYAEAGEKGWALPCFGSENLTTTEAVLSAAEDCRAARGLPRLPVILAITCLYPHRSQAVNYTHTKRWYTGLKLFTEDIKILCENGGPFESLDVMIHLDHIQHDLDFALLESDLCDYASILYDASALPLAENIEKTAAFVKKRGGGIVVEGACDEVADAGTIAELTAEGVLTKAANKSAGMNINRFTALYRNNIMFEKIKSIAGYYFDMWYKNPH